MGNGWSIAWRVHDAQFWGVPQRRKRIALVADFGGETAPEILFERKSLSGDIEQSTAQGQEVAGAASDSTREPGAYTLKIRGGVERDCYGKKAGKGPLVQTELSATLGVSQDQTLIQKKVFGISSYSSNSMKSSNPDSGIYEADTIRTLDNNGGNPACNQGGMMILEGNYKADGADGNGVAFATVGDHDNRPTDMTNLIYQKTTGSLCASGYDKLGTQEAANDMYVIQAQSWDGSQVSPTLTANNAGGAQRMPDKDNFNAVVQSLETFHCVAENEKTQTLKARDYKDPHCVAYGLDRASYNQGQNAQFDFAIDQEKVGTQVAKGPGAVCAKGVNNAGTQNFDGQRQPVHGCAIVRRLTPLEAERLQGFPDGWTDIGVWIDSKGKIHKDADSPRYKALGNSIALPFWQWMAEKMVRYVPDHPTMASLFDGISGFPLVFSRCGCKPVWASEIEEFPIAVAKKRFPEMS